MKTAFITGGSQGLGRGLVEALLQRGYEVFATTREITPLKHPEMERLHWIELEVTDDGAIERAYEFVSKRVSALDLLINNAGVNKDTVAEGKRALVSELDHLDRQLLLKMFDVNAVSPILIVKQFRPLLTVNPSFVINISSCRASFHDREENEYGNYGYRASKVALNMFTLCALHDLPHNVKIFSIHPGNIRSSMNPNGTMSPQKQAEEILSIPERFDDSIHGAFLNYDGSPYPL